MAVLSLSGVAASSPAQELTLDQCVELALARNPGLAAEAARVRVAQANHEAAQAPLRPQLSATAYSNRLNEDRLSPGGVTPAPGTSLYTRESFAGLTVRQLLYDGGRSTGGREAAARALDGQRSGLAAARDETVLRVTQAFYRALAARELVRVAQDVVKRQHAFETMTSDLFHAGKATRLDALKAEAARLDAERLLTAAGEAEVVATVQLAQAMGRDGGARVTARGALPRALAEPPRSEALIEEALAGNPDLQRAAHEIDQSRETLRSARGARRPDLALQGDYGYRDRDVGGGRPDWLVGLAASWTLYSGGATSAQTARARAQLAEVQELKRALALDIETQVHEALAGWRTALSDARAASRLVETEREAVRAAETLYGAGKATALDALSAQADLARAEGAQVTSFADYAIARARIASLTGASSTETNP
jgi:OMF family outer membrane factor